MKRYVLFAGDTYYPEGGANDLIDSFDTIEKAITSFGELILEEPKFLMRYEWANILDIKTGRIVNEFQEEDGWSQEEINDEIQEESTEQKSS